MEGRAWAWGGCLRLKVKNFLDVEIGRNLCLATHCQLLPGSLHSLGYHHSLPSNKYLLHWRKEHRSLLCKPDAELGWAVGTQEAKELPAGVHSPGEKSGINSHVLRQGGLYWGNVEYQTGSFLMEGLEWDSHRNWRRRAGSLCICTPSPIPAPPPCPFLPVCHLFPSNR